MTRSPAPAAGAEPLTSLALASPPKDLVFRTHTIPAPMAGG